jgi:hypothetical protein
MHRFGTLQAGIAPRRAGEWVTRQARNQPMNLDDHADGIETTVDLHGRTLAVQLGLTCDGPLDRDTGYRITQRLRKDPG